MEIESVTVSADGVAFVRFSGEFHPVALPPGTFVRLHHGAVVDAVYVTDKQGNRIVVAASLRNPVRLL